jgi:hypothetical protein
VRTRSARHLPTAEASYTNSQIVNGLLEIIDKGIEAIELLLNTRKRTRYPHEHAEDDLLLHMQWKVAKRIAR